jgi:signal transduction histidine kinase
MSNHTISKGNVLVVDDQHKSFDLLMSSLSDIGFAVSSVRTGTELTQALQHEIAVAVAHQQGLETVGLTDGLLFRNFDTPGPFWIVLRDGPPTDDLTQAYNRGELYYYLRQPSALSDLCALIQRTAEHYQLHLQHQQLRQPDTAQPEFATTSPLAENNSAVSDDQPADLLSQMVYSDKMATLGQMLAGVAHEINTPSGAIGAAVTNMQHHLKALIDDLQVLDTQGITQPDFQELMRIVDVMSITLDAQHRRSSGEVRQEQARLQERLQHQGVQQSRKLAKQIARMNLSDHLDQLFALAQTYDLDRIFMFLTHWDRIINSASDIKVSITMLTRLIHSLKSYSYPSQEAPKLTDVHESIDLALTILSNKLKHRVQVERCYGDVPRIRCYASDLSHVWINLIHNAIQAIAEEGEIRIETFPVGDSVGIKITDNGPGIPPAILDRIFDKNFTTKPQGEGTGLGLYIVRQIVAKHGGTIDVSSHPGQTTFEIQLPQ